MYPTVKGELETLSAVLMGNSIARFGDGEFNLVAGGNCVSQRGNPFVSAALRKILRKPNIGCIVGIPTMDPIGPKFVNWAKYSSRYNSSLNGKVQYYSAFITRPDSAPWIDTKGFFDQIESLWREQRVTLVCNGVRSLQVGFLMERGAAQVDWVKCLYRDAFEEIDDLEQRIITQGNKRVLLCAGPTATILADRLAPQGFHAVDLGHIGMFWRRYENDKVRAALVS